MSIFESKKTTKYKEMAWNYQAVVEVVLGDFDMISERVANASMSRADACEYLLKTGLWLREKHNEFEKEYND